MLIETPRLRLRPFSLEDLVDFTALAGDPAFQAWSLFGPLNAQQARHKLEALIALYETQGFSKWAITTKQDPRSIGYCGLGLEEIEGRSLPEFGYRLAPAFRGQGLATEAARAAIADAFDRLGLSEIHAFAEPGNTASLRVLEKLGLSYLKNITLHDRSWRLHRLERPTSQVA